MIRDLRRLAGAILPFVAIGAFVVSANAAQFTAPGAGGAGTTTIFSERDVFNPPEGTTAGQTSHQVFDIRKADGTGVLSMTCNEAFWTGATLAGESSPEVITTIDFRSSAVNSNCPFAGQTVPISTGNCAFRFTAGGQLHIEDDGVQSLGNKCAHGEKPITFSTTVLDCKVEVGAQTIGGIGFHNVIQNGKGTITLERTNTSFQYNATGTGCPYGTTSNGLYTTGNTILKGERGGAVVNITWDP